MDMTEWVESAIVVMTKAPKPGEAKTRLCPPLTFEQAAELYSCFLRDRIRQAKTVPGAEVVVAFPESVTAEQRSRYSDGCEMIFQRGNDLGEREVSCASRAFELGYRQVLIVGSDSPTLPTDYFGMALDALRDGTNIVIGPSEDGGYYLIGLSAPYPEVFAGIPWSTGDVARVTLERARRAGLTVGLLPQWYDVDTGAELIKLQKELKEPAAASIAPSTAEWMMNWSAGLEP
jgi:rSAM/selenodomain-associated transferase 1